MKRIAYPLLLLLIPTLVFAQTTQMYTSFLVKVETIPSMLEPGDSGNLIVTITNTGTLYGRNVKLRIEPNQYVTLEKYEFDLQTIDAGDSAQVAIPIKVSRNTPYGTLAIFYTISYSEGESSGTKTMSGAASLNIRRRPSLEIIEVKFDKEKIEPGSEVTLSLRVKNVGKGKAKDVSLALETKDLPFVPVGTTSFFVGDLEAGETAEVSFKLIVNENAEIKAYPIPVKFVYYDEEGNKSEGEKTIGIKLYGKPEFVVAIDSTENLFTNSIGRVTFSIANRGVATGKYVTVRVESEIPVMPDEYYIGNIEPDDYETVDFNPNLAGVPPGKHELTLHFFYKDPYNNELNETRSFQINVNKPSVRGNYWIIVVVVILLFLWKRKKLLKKK